MTLKSLIFYIGEKWKITYIEKIKEMSSVNLHLRKERGKDMREIRVEHRLLTEVTKRKGMCPKFVSPGMAGMPDRLILLPGGRMAFAELKAPGRIPRPLQLARHKKLRALGFSVYVIDDLDEIGGVLDEISAT